LGVGCLLAIYRSCLFFFVISHLTGRISPLNTSNPSLISEIVDTIGYFFPGDGHDKSSRIMKDNPHSQHMKTKIVLGLIILLGAGFISARAADNPAQATARTALLQKLNEPAHPQTPPALQTPRLPRALQLPLQFTPSGIEKKPRCIYAAINLGKC